MPYLIHSISIARFFEFPVRKVKTSPTFKQKSKASPKFKQIGSHHPCDRGDMPRRRLVHHLEDKIRLVQAQIQACLNPSQLCLLLIALLLLFTPRFIHDTCKIQLSYVWTAFKFLIVFLLIEVQRLIDEISRLVLDGHDDKEDYTKGLQVYEHITGACYFLLHFLVSKDLKIVPHCSCFVYFCG